VRRAMFQFGVALFVGIAALVGGAPKSWASDADERLFGWAANDRGSRVEAPFKAIQCGELLDVLKREVRRDVTVLIEGQRIVAVEKGKRTPKDADAVIDLSDQVCLPGVIDSYAHLTGYIFRNGETHRPQDPIHYAISETALGLAHAREMLYTGVTTLRTPSEYLPKKGPAFFRDAIRQGYHPGPRIFLADISIGYDYAWEIVLNAGENKHRLRKPNYLTYDGVVPGKSDVRQAVRDVLSHGEEWVKVAAEVAGRKSHAIRLFSAQELKDMADEAHKLGAKITAHVHSDEVAREAILAGYDSLELAYLSRSNADLLKERGVYWSHSLSDLRLTYDAHDPLIGEDAPLSNNRDVSEQIARRDAGFKYAYEIGAPMVYASYTWFNPGNHRGRMVLEFSEYLNLGATP